MNRGSDQQGKTCHLLLFTPHREDGESWAKTLAKEELEITIVTDLRVAKSSLEKRQYDYLLVGISSNDCDGMKLLEWANDTIIGIRKCGVLKKAATNSTTGCSVLAPTGVSTMNPLPLTV